MLRMRNHFVVTAGRSGGDSGSERRHALALYVHIREQDVRYFNGGGNDEESKSDVNYIEHVLGLLDADTDFEALVRGLDSMRPVSEELTKSSKTAASKTVTSPLAHLQWRAVLDPSHHGGVANVLAATHRQRSECFECETTGSGDKKTLKKAASEGVYVGGMFAPLPLRRVAVEVWLYPPHVTIPATGNRLPADDASVTDFLHDDDSVEA